MFSVFIFPEDRPRKRVDNLLNVVRFEFVHDEKERHHSDGDEDADSGAPARRLPVEIRLLGVVGGVEATSRHGVENRRAAETNVAK